MLRTVRGAEKSEQGCGGRDAHDNRLDRISHIGVGVISPLLQEIGLGVSHRSRDLSNVIQSIPCLRRMPFASPRFRDPYFLQIRVLFRERQAFRHNLLNLFNNSCCALTSAVSLRIAAITLGTCDTGMVAQEKFRRR